ncbi:MAG: glycine--tRNA ligase [Halobacteriota archaeon]|nr:glycine--tRNA ligase [Halobacteriota archaeon]
MDIYEKVIDLAKRRGFLWPSFELYGGMAGFYDYGPLGTLLKRQIESKWRNLYIIQEGFFEIDTPTVNPEDVFVASGHVGGFTDPVVQCTKCQGVFRADHLIECEEIPAKEELQELLRKSNVKCPDCKGELGGIDEATLMFNTSIGLNRRGYLRPETAQGIFIDFNRLLRFYRERIPFGVIQMGRAYRNEISPRQGVIRLREFTLAEAEIFVDPRDKSHSRFNEVEGLKLALLSMDNKEKCVTIGEAVKDGVVGNEFIGYYMARTYQFLMDIGLSSDKVRFRQHREDERAHYATDCWDAEAYSERFGWVEIVGIADRTNYDLSSHSRISQVDLNVLIPYDEPKVVEKLVVKPDMSKIGPLFKDKSGKILERLKELTSDDLESNPVVIDLDGEEISVDRGLISTETIEETIAGETVVPHVVEPSYGIDRIFYLLLEHSYHEDMVEEETRTVLRFASGMSPVKVAVLPLLSRDELIEKAREVESILKSRGILVEYDESGTIGRRYRRQDEIGTPYSITIDYDTLEDDSVTLRDRDSMKQKRIEISDLKDLSLN